jgi:hypothetical protein
VESVPIASCSFSIPLAVVNDLNIEGAAIFPTEADPPSLVDPDTVLTPPVPFQSFQMIAGRNPQVLEKARPMKVEKFSSCGTLNRPKARHRLIVKQGLSRLVLEGLDHHVNIVRETSYFKSIPR